MRGIMAALGAAVLLSATVATAQTTVIQDQQGRFVRYDAASQVIVLDDGRMYRVGPNTTVWMDNRPVAYTALQPGQVIVVRSAQPVVSRNGLYTAVGPSGAPEAPPSTGTSASPSVTVVTPSPAPTAVVTPPPPAPTVIAGAPATTTTVVTPSTSLRRTVYGTVTDVDRNEIRVRTDRGSFEVPMLDARTSGIRKGDNVQVDLTVVPGGPAALPR